MLRVGLTGNIAAGKSTVAQVWRRLGGLVVDADELARRAVEPGTAGYGQIVRAWGDAVLDGAGALDRAALRGIVFSDPIARARLEQIVHPAVAALRDEAYRAAQAEGRALVAAEVPLLFESALTEEFDRIVLVDAPEPLRLARLIEERGLGEDEAWAMMEAQMPATLKRARADVVIENTGTREELEEEAARVWHGLTALAEPDAPA